MLSVTSIDFGNQDLNTTSATKVLTVTNSSATDALAIASIDITGANAGEYSVDSSAANACAASLPASAFCDVSVKFMPTAAGPRTADLVVTTNATGTTLTIPLSGSGSAVTGPTPTSTPATNIGSGGCSIQSTQSFDPILAALFLLSLTATLARRWANWKYRCAIRATKNGTYFKNQI
jgi:hypothetical protein